jgi:hypothetical protein
MRLPVKALVEEIEGVEPLGVGGSASPNCDGFESLRRRTGSSSNWWRT